MKIMRVVLSLLALAGTALGNGHGRFLVDKMCWEAKTDPAKNDLNTLAGVKKHSSKCIMACLEGKSNLVALKCTEGADPECEVDFEIDVTQTSEGVDNATVTYLKNLINSSNCNNDWELLVTGGDKTDAVGDGNDMWEIGSGSLERHDTCAVKEGEYYLVDNACWSAGEDPKGNDLTTLAGVKKHSTGCLKMAMCYQSGYSLVQADDNGVVSKKYSVASGTCSEMTYTDFATCDGSALGVWTFSDDEKDLQAQVNAFDSAGCKDNVAVQVQDVYDETTVNGDVVTDANFSLTCSLKTPDEPKEKDDSSGAAIASMAGLIAGALLL